MSTTVEPEIIIQPVTPNAPVALCNAGFLSTLAQVEREITALAVTDAQTSQAAANLQQRLTKAGTTLESERKRLTQPFLDKQREIAAAAQAPAARIDAAKRAVGKKLVDFKTEQDRLAQIAENNRQAELRRLEAIRQAEIVAEQKRQAELVRQAQELKRVQDEEAAKRPPAPVVVDLDDEEPDDVPDEPEPVAAPVKTETEKAIEAVRYAPVVAARAPVGVAFRARLVHKVTDVNKLPDSLVIRTPNDKGIRALFCEQWKDGAPLPVVPGVEFTVDRTAASTGRGAF